MMSVQVVGGIGMFLLGMILLTDGIKASAGGALRKVLGRLTGSPGRAFWSGLIVTVLVQSSSATTVTVIGFVSAGLMTFHQAIWVVMGSSLGTTGTGWLVSILGLKFSLGTYALPILAVGVFIRLLGRQRLRHAGLAIAGFALIFLGIEMLQRGMSELSTSISISSRDSSSLLDHLVLMLVGVVMTVLMQSSSAAMTTILTALHTDAVNFDQAASLVIGAAVGTTVTSLIAAIGANMSARRTAVAHVAFNLISGLIAIILLPLLLKLIYWVEAYFQATPDAIGLAAFHTLFIAIGVLIFIPFVGRFSKLIERVLPEDRKSIVRHLDESILNVPDVALETTRKALSESARAIFEAEQLLLAEGTWPYPDSRIPNVREALVTIEGYLGKLLFQSDDTRLGPIHTSQLHALDHLIRLENSSLPPMSVIDVIHDPLLETSCSQTARILHLASAGLRGDLKDDWWRRVQTLANEMAELRRRERPLILEGTSRGHWTPDRSLNVLDAMRWLDRVTYHTWRICNYLHADPSHPSPDPDRLDPP